MESNGLNVALNVAHAHAHALIRAHAVNPPLSCNRFGTLSTEMQFPRNELERPTSNHTGDTCW